MFWLKLTFAILLLAAISLITPRALHAQYNINLTAGGGPNGLLALSSSIGYPASVVQDANGNTYIADAYSNRVYEVSSAGTLTVFAGNGFNKTGEGGYSGDGGPATSAELGGPQGLAVDASGDVFIADTGNSVIRCVVGAAGGCFGATLAVGSITTVAGNGTQCQPSGSTCGDGGTATSAQLYNPAGVFLDSLGNLLIADTGDSKIRCVVGQTGACLGVSSAAGTIITVAGTGTAGFSGDSTAATSAQLDLPNGIFVDSGNNLYVADTENSVVRCVVGTPGGCLDSTVAVGSITTVAGVYYSFDATSPPTCNYSGDGGAATSAQLCLPSAVFLDGSGNLFIADTENSLIRCVVGAAAGGCFSSTLAVGDITTVAGSATLGAGFSGDGAAATSAQLNLSSGILVDSTDDIFIADTSNFRIRCVVGAAGGCLGSTLAVGDITTLMGNGSLAYSGDGGSPTSASLDSAAGVAVDASGNIYIADTYNNVIREIVQATGDIVTVAGNGAPGFSGDGGLATSAQLDLPQGVFVDSLGDIFIADTENFAVRCVVVASGGCLGSTLAVGSITTVAGVGTQQCLPAALPCGDGGPATSGQLGEVFGVYVDNTGANNTPGNLFIADTSDSEVRCVVGVAGGCFGSALAVGSITTVAGDGTECAPAGSTCGDGSAATSAQLNFPAGVYGDSFGNLFIADTLDSKVRCVVGTTGGCYGSALVAGSITTVAGGTTGGYSGDGGPATSALLNEPYDMFVDSMDNLFIADSENSALREIVAVTGNIQTLAGNGTAGYAGDPGPASNAQLATPLGVAGDTLGDIFVADTENSRVRELTSTVSVAMVPTSATLPTGGPQQFAATVTGASNTYVTWEVNGVIGGNATVGTITSLGSYTAPTSIPSPANVTVTAVANANGFNTASAQVSIVSGSTTVTVTISTSPTVTEVYTGTMQTFVANVSDNANTAVNWEVNGEVGGDSTIGTISTTGVYSAPTGVPTPATVVIGAVSQANTTVSASYPILIVPAPTAPSPASQTASAGSSATFSTALAAKTGDPKQALTLSCLKSSLPAGATCTFAPPTITPGSTSVPFSLTVNLPACSAANIRPNENLMTPHLYLAFLPMATFLLIGLGNRKKLRQLLLIVLLFVPISLLPGCGSGSSSSGSCPNLAGTYNIVVLGASPAQPNPVTITTVTLVVK